MEHAEIAEAIAIFLCRRHEGFRPRPYLCPAGVPSIGYGTTRYLLGPLAGHAVTLSDPPISEPEARAELLAWIRREVLPYVLRLCPGLETPEQLGAILDWTYNLGWPNLRASTLRRKINSKEFDRVPAEIRKWNRGGGRQLPGLDRRRGDEVLVWLGFLTP